MTTDRSDSVPREEGGRKGTDRDPFATGLFGGSPRTAISASETSTDATTVRGSRSARATSSSGRERRSSFVLAWETLCLRGDFPVIDKTDKAASNVAYSATRVRSSRRSLSDRLTLSLMSAGLVCGITPSLTRKRSGQPIQVLAFDTPDGSAAARPRAVLSFSNSSHDATLTAGVPDVR